MKPMNDRSVTTLACLFLSRSFVDSIPFVSCTGAFQRVFFERAEIE